MARKMPKQRPGKSESTVLTPSEFIETVKDKLGIESFAIDLAALESNSHGDVCFTPEEDSLRQRWRHQLLPSQWAWLNPPYSDIAPWIRKAQRADRKIAVLVPASVGSNWWRDYVHEKAWVLFLNGRITFNDKNGKPICSNKTGKPTPYPKDLALLVYGLEPGYDIWDWKRS